MGPETPPDENHCTDIMFGSVKATQQPLYILVPNDYWLADGIIDFVGRVNLALKADPFFAIKEDCTIST